MSETRPRRSAKFPWQVRLAEALTAVLFAVGVRRDGTVRRRVLSLLDFHAPPNPVPADGVATSDHVVDPARSLSVRVFAPTPEEESSPAPVVIVYFHGGGFVFNSAFSHPYDAFCRRLARRVPARVVTVDYHLAPEHRFPAAYDDCFDAVAWLDDSLAAADAPAAAVFLAGESAGGNIAHHVARRMQASSFRRLTPAGVVAVQPFFGGEEDTESERRLEGVPMGSRERYKWMWRSFLPEGSSLDHEAANVFGPGPGSEEHGDWSGFPPTMVVVGGMDTLQDRQRWYCEGLRRAGVEVCVREYENAIHAFQFFEGLPEAEQMVVDVADFIREVVGSGRK
ncbi:putative carboxylesterase 18 [Iris pallida]|uniref:Carboxylesterase 18 n=1 Tax=Iris pallida TaxID=29817 RepID=A0AAX6H671_IRIPA|nr:putative carboxylesterase 18 [Iris pallida]